MIHLSAPVLAHSSQPCAGSLTHWRHSSVLALTSEAVTDKPDHSFAMQDRAIYRTIYSDIHRVLQQIQLDLTNDPTAARKLLDATTHQLTTLLQ